MDDEIQAVIPVVGSEIATKADLEVFKQEVIELLTAKNVPVEQEEDFKYE